MDTMVERGVLLVSISSFRTATTNALFRTVDCNCWSAKTQPRTWPRSPRRDTLPANREALPFAKSKATRTTTDNGSSLPLLLASPEKAAFPASSMFPRS